MLYFMSKIRYDSLNCYGDPMYLNTNQVIYKKDAKCFVFRGFHGTFPKEVYLESHKTGKVEKFMFNERDAIQCEFWDGEESHYSAWIKGIGEVALILTRS